VETPWALPGLMVGGHPVVFNLLPVCIPHGHTLRRSEWCMAFLTDKAGYPVGPSHVSCVVPTRRECAVEARAFDFCTQP
jgi:hypothetical protein